ncbi:MAG: LON peptidase substrate-binding domain-containing protein [Polyangiales bacterium]
MRPDPGEARAALESVPVFPLPGLVLLPEQRLPLHIFEPRYRAMVRDILEGSPFLVVACVVGELDADLPRISSIATVGRVTAHQRLPDGRFNILVEGQVRVSLEELPFTPPYRRARATPLPEPEPAEVRPAVRAALLSVATQVIRAAKAKTPQWDFTAPMEMPSSRLALKLVDRFVDDPAGRLSVLRAEGAEARVARATTALASVLAEGADAPSGMN